MAQTQGDAQQQEGAGGQGQGEPPAQLHQGFGGVLGQEIAGGLEPAMGGLQQPGHRRHVDGVGVFLLLDERDLAIIFMDGRSVKVFKA